MTQTAGVSIFLGVVIVCISTYIFKYITKLFFHYNNHRANIATLFIFQGTKIGIFATIGYWCFKFIAVDPSMFLGGIILGITISFVKNLLRLLI